MTTAEDLRRVLHGTTINSQCSTDDAWVQLQRRLAHTETPHSTNRTRVSRRRPLLAAAVALVVVAALVGLVLALQPSSTSHRKVVVPPASGGESFVAPFEPANDLVPYGPDPTDSILPERIAVSGPDGNWAGFADRDVLRGIPNYAAYPDNPQAAVAAWERVRISVTRTADPASELVGYYFPGAGFIDLQTYDSPTFDLDALIAAGNAKEEQEQQRARAAGLIK